MYLNGYDAWIYGENVSRRYYFVITVSQEFFLILLLINASVLSRKEKFVSIPVGSSIVSSRSLALIYFYRIRMEPMSTISIEGIESGYKRISQGGTIFKQTLGGNGNGKCRDGRQSVPNPRCRFKKVASRSSWWWSKLKNLKHSKPTTEL